MKKFYLVDTDIAIVDCGNDLTTITSTCNRLNRKFYTNGDECFILEESELEQFRQIRKDKLS